MSALSNRRHKMVGSWAVPDRETNLGRLSFEQMQYVGRSTNIQKMALRIPRETLYLHSVVPMEGTKLSLVAIHTAAMMEVPVLRWNERLSSY